MANKTSGVRVAVRADQVSDLRAILDPLAEDEEPTVKNHPMKGSKYLFYYEVRDVPDFIQQAIRTLATSATPF